MPVKTSIEEISDKRKKKELAELLAHRAQFSRIKKNAEEEIEACNAALVPMLQSLDIVSILAYDDMGMPKRFVVTQGSNSSINKQKLLLASVHPDIIAQCTTVSKFTTIQVRDIKEAE